MANLQVLLPPRAVWAERAWGQQLQSLLDSGKPLRDATDNYAEIARLMGYAGPPAPAGVRRALSFDDSENAFWLLAEPAHCRADLTDAFVIGLSHRLDLSYEDAVGLSQELSEDLPAGASFQLSQDGTWYVRLPSPVQMTCLPPDRVVGQSLGRAMPQGADAASWKRTINAAQIVLHQSEINQRRVANDRVAVNALLFWGTGAWPVRPVLTKLRVASADCRVIWLGQFSGQAVADLRRNDEQGLTERLDVLDLTLVEESGVEQLLAAPEQLYGRTGSAEIDWHIEDDQVLRTQRSKWWQFWRR